MLLVTSLRVHRVAVCALVPGRVCSFARARVSRVHSPRAHIARLLVRWLSTRLAVSARLFAPRPSVCAVRASSVCILAACLWLKVSCRLSLQLCCDSSVVVLLGSWLLGDWYACCCSRGQWCSDFGRLLVLLVSSAATVLLLFVVAW